MATTRTNIRHQITDNAVRSAALEFTGCPDRQATVHMLKALWTDARRKNIFPDFVFQGDQGSWASVTDDEIIVIDGGYPVDSNEWFEPADTHTKAAVETLINCVDQPPRRAPERRVSTLGSCWSFDPNVDTRLPSERGYMCLRTRDFPGGRDT